MTKFFTNQANNTLLNKFKGVFEYNQHLNFFDVLVGYFRASGYFKLRPHLDNIEQIRILVGIDVDRYTKEAQQQGLAFNFGAKKEQVVKDYQEQLQTEINQAEYTQEIETSIKQFIADIINQKIIIKAHPSKKIHAKLYIFRPQELNEHNSGEVITGSSNLTEAGLGSNNANYEFNVSLRDYDDVKFAIDEFEKLWSEGTTILPEQVQQARDNTYLKDKFTPFELYIKLLIEYFGSEIEFDPNSITDLPKKFKRLEYQMDAVHQGYKILKKHNGFFLSDVVGLGKTIVAIMVARQFFHYNNFPEYRSRTLIICPPALIDNWKDTIDKFHLDNTTCESIGKLHTINNHKNYDLIIVDEAHRFRNDTSEAYQNLQIICKAPCRNGQRKKVILVSATPLNNRPNDIKNQLLLFQDANDSTLDVNLKTFFARISDKYQELEQNIFPDAQKINTLSKQIRDKIIEPITVRRTRTDLETNERYEKDLRRQGIKFPQVQKPNILLYPLEDDLSQLYDDTMLMLNDVKAGLCYMRYRAIEYLVPEHQKDYQRPEFIAERLAGIMKTLLLKRLDSSFHAFVCSLNRFVQASEAMITMVKNNRIYIAPDHKVTEYINAGNEDELEAILMAEKFTDLRIKTLATDDFQDGFVTGLKRDHDILLNLQQQWQAVVNNKPDPKLASFFDELNNELLNTDKNPTKKIVIFSESKDTTAYLETKLNDHLESKGYGKVLSVHSKNRNRLKNTIKENFDANIDQSLQKSEYDIIITTEVLAEGVNLHRANTIVNYDTPWNATRLMQRIGRVNRIGSTASDIYIHNFFPTDKIEGDLGLSNRAQLKLQVFHSALGEDSQIYSPNEEVKTFGLFDQSVGENKEVSKRLIYLTEIRKFREDNPDEFKRIKNLPLKIRNAVANSAYKNGTISYLRNDQFSCFYQLDANDNIEELGFLEVAPILKANQDQASKPMHNQHHQQVRRAIEHFEQRIKEKIVADQQVMQLTSQQSQAINYIRAFFEIADETEKQNIQQAIEWIELGSYQNLERAINKLNRTLRKNPLVPAKQLEAIMNIIQKYNNNQAVNDEPVPINKPQSTIAITPKIIISQSYI